MIKLYIQATNNGVGFITHDDQELSNLTFEGAPADIWVVSCATQSPIDTWMTRVSGASLTKSAAQSTIDAALAGVTDPITNQQVTYILA